MSVRAVVVTVGQLWEWSGHAGQQTASGSKGSCQYCTNFKLLSGKYNNSGSLPPLSAAAHTTTLLWPSDQLVAETST